MELWEERVKMDSRVGRNCTDGSAQQARSGNVGACNGGKKGVLKLLVITKKAFSVEKKTSN